MSVTILDPVTALIVIDLQKGILAMPLGPSIDGVVQRSIALAGCFRRQQLPVVLVNVTGRPPGRTEQARFRGDFPGDFADFIPELSPQPGDHVVSKQTAGAFTNTNLDTYLKSRGATQVVIAGVATSMGVESTARQAHELGFHVTLATDAMMDLDADLHARSVTKIFPRLGETGTASEIVALLERSER